MIVLLALLGSLSIVWRVFIGWTGAPAPAGNAFLLGSAPGAGAAGVKFHSHNDYEHTHPLFDALRAGVESIEADVWLVGGELLVGHTRGDLRPARTFAALYLDPLAALLFAHNSSAGKQLEDEYPSLAVLPLQLLVDLKTDGPATFDAVHASLAPLRAAGLLSTWTTSLNASRPAAGLLTVVGTGNTPLSSVRALGQPGAPPRDLFLDAALDALPTDASPALCPLASAHFIQAIGLRNLWAPWLARRRVRALVRAAHAKGVPARFFGAPGGWRWARRHAWALLLAERVDWLNIDDFRHVRALRKHLAPAPPAPPAAGPARAHARDVRSPPPSS